MQTRHQRQREEADKKKNEILPPALKRSKQYIDARGLAGGCVNGVKFVDGESKNNAIVTGASGKSYNVDLSTFSCDCCGPRVICHHLSASATKKHGGNDAIDQYFPDELKMERYLGDLEIMGDFPPYPSDERIEEHRDLYDFKLRIPVAIRAKKGRPKKNRRYKTWRDNNKKRPRDASADKLLTKMIKF